MRKDESMLRAAVEGFDQALAEPSLATLGWDHGTAQLNRANTLGRLFDVTLRANNSETSIPGEFRP
jgi:hypothetical protein